MPWRVPFRDHTCLILQSPLIHENGARHGWILIGLTRNEACNTTHQDGCHELGPGRTGVGGTKTITVGRIMSDSGGALIGSNDAYDNVSDWMGNGNVVWKRLDVQIPGEQDLVDRPAWRRWVRVDTRSCLGPP